MFRCIFAKRLLKSAKTRYLGSKHERTPSTLHEYLETPLPNKGLWRSWFPVLVVVPLVYYLFFATSVSVIEQTSTEDPEMDQEKESFDSLPIRYSSALFLLDNKTHSQNLLPIEMDANKSFLARTPVHNEKNIYYSYGPDEPQYVFNHYSLKTVVEYRALLSKGGYFESQMCRARHRVAIIVPYRDRERNLAVFLYIMHPFLIEQGLEYRIFVIEQSGNDPFNRGRLLNIGFLEAQKHGAWECMAFHDVDLLPTTDQIKYTCPTWPRHMCGSILGRPETDKYKSHYGGVTMMTPNHYEKVNGYSNWYWGWGGEDTDMFWRIKTSGLAVTRYSKTVAVYKAMPHTQNPENPIRNTLIKTAGSRYKTDGLSNCHYKIIAKTLYHTYTHILVDINPDKENVTEFRLNWQ